MLLVIRRVKNPLAKKVSIIVKSVCMQAYYFYVSVFRITPIQGRNQEYRKGVSKCVRALK